VSGPLGGAEPAKRANGPELDATQERCAALARHVVSLALAADAQLAVAESLTAGLVAGTLGSVAGVSAVLRGGVVAYATDLKTALLGVDEGLLARGGAVQAEVAAAMAEGVAARLGAAYGVATTGVAGPDPQDGQPPGTVFVGVWGPSGGKVVGRTGDSVLAGDRDLVRWSAVELALGLLTDVLEPEHGGRAHG
jgi:nicotinamide-nucleotide amidase